MSSLLECSSLLSVHLSGLRCQTGLHSVNRDTRPPRHHAGAFDVSLGLQRWAGLGWAGWAGLQQTRLHFKHAATLPAQDTLAAQRSGWRAECRVAFRPSFPLTGLVRTWAKWATQLTFREASSQKPILDLMSVLGL